MKQFGTHIVCVVPGCDRKSRARGLCTKHYGTTTRQGQLDRFPALSFSERFWNRVERTPTCWLWRGALRKNGYAQIKLDGRTQLVHRVAYELAVGPIPKNLTLDHLCRVHHCVNPAHLEPVTVRENTLRGLGPAALNARKTACPRGHEYDYFDRRGRRHCQTCWRERKRDLGILKEATA